MSAKYLASTLLMLSAIVATTGAGQAAVVGTTTLKSNPPTVAFTAPDAALGAPWQSYTLGLQTTAGELIGGVIVDIHGQLHQRWNYDNGSGTYLPTVYSTAQSNGDSHLLGFSGLFEPANEDNSFVGSPLADTATADYGVGSKLYGSWGLTTPSTTTNAAYIVVPRNRLYELKIDVLIANPNGDIIGQLTERDFFPNVPEPASGVLLAMGILGFAGGVRRLERRVT